MNSVSNNGKNNLKILNSYAEKAKEKIDTNNNLHKIYNLYLSYINEIKNILSNKDKIEQNIINLNINLKNNIKINKLEYEKLKSKYDDYRQKCTDELEMERPLLDQVSSDYFTLKYSLLQKDLLIQKLKNNIKGSKKYNLFREPKREEFIENKEANAFIKTISDESQLSLLIIAKKYNKLKEKVKKRQQKAIALIETKKLLDEFINSINNNCILKNKDNQCIDSEIKTRDKTSSTNNSSNNIDNIKSFNSKSNKNFNFCDNLKLYEEDTNYTNCNNKKIIIDNTENITNAILSATIPNSFKSFKVLSANPILDPILNKEINSNKYNNININNIINEEGKNSKKNYNINISKALSEDNRNLKKDRKQIKNKNRNKNNNKIIQSFLNLEDLFEDDSPIEEESEALIDIIINSDDETIFENKISQNKSISKTYIEKVTKEIPKINLALIEYNKLKVNQEIDLYSLQRRNYKGENMEDNIKMMSKKIKGIEKKENLNNKKAIIMKKYIDELKNKYLLYKKIRTKSSAFNCEVKYFSNNEIIDLKNSDNDNENNSFGSDYLNEDDEISDA